MAAEVVHEQVGEREDRDEQPADQRRHEQGDDDDDGEDRQRRAHQEPEEHDGRHLDGAERAGGCFACQQGVLLELLGGRVRSGHDVPFVDVWQGGARRRAGAGWSPGRRPASSCSSCARSPVCEAALNAAKRADARRLDGPTALAAEPSARADEKLAGVGFGELEDVRDLPVGVVEALAEHVDGSFGG